MLKINLLLIFLSSFLISKTTEEVLKLEAYTTNLNPKINEEFEIQVNLKLADYWYTYSNEIQLSAEGIGPAETQFNILDESIFSLNGEIKTPNPNVKFDEGFEMEIKYYDGEYSVIIPVIAKRDIDFQKEDLKIEVYVQVCDTVSCLPPSPLLTKIDKKIDKTNLYFNPSKVGKNKKEDKKSVQTKSSSDIEDAKKQGTWGFLLFSMLAGLAALTTPCVFPMIPITVSFFTKRAEKPNSKSLADALLFALGIVSTFTIIGLVVTLIFGATGVSDLATSPIMNFLIAAVFLVFAFNLFGAFEIQIPTKFLNFMNNKSQSGGSMGIILMGFTFSLTSFTCTVPFVGSSLLSTQGGDYYYPIIGMIGFSSVFALPFFLLALFPTLMKKLPKSGGWMNNIKVVMGFLEIAAAMKFISNIDLAFGWEIITRDLFLSTWIACGFLIVIYILGFYQFKLDSKVERIGAMRAVWAVIFATITIYLITGLLGKQLGEVDAFLPPEDYGVVQSSIFNKSESSEKELNWLTDYNEAVEIAKKENKQIFIDFTGWQCTNCRWMEKNMFPLENVKTLMKDMVLVKLYTDRRQEPEISNKSLQQSKFNSIALPLYVLMDSKENTIGTIEFTRNKDEFLDFLNKN